MKIGHTHVCIAQNRWGIVCYVTILLMLSSHTPAATWEIIRLPSSKNDTETCILHSPTKPVSDGYLGTQAMIAVYPEAIRVATQAPLDPSFADIGLQVDQGPLISMDEVVERKSAQFTAQYGALIEQFKQGHQVRVQLRFWPTWPTTGPHAATFSLIGFTKAYADMQACQHEPTTNNGQKP